MGTPLPTLVTPPTFQPVTLQEAKYQVKVPHAVSGHDAELSRLIEAAIQEAQTDTAIVAAQSDWAVTYQAFPVGGIRLPYRNVSAVSEVKVTDSSGETILDPTSYRLVNSLVWPELWPTDTWPETEDGYVYPISVTFTAGAPDWKSVDVGVKQAALAFIDNIFSSNGETEAKTEGFGRVYEAVVARRFATYP